VIHLKETTQGVILSVRAQPGAKRNAITGVHNGALRVSVTAAPDKGKANDAIINVLADAFQLAKSAVQLQSGVTSRQKTFFLQGVKIDLVKSLLAKRLG
jgi:uncharacterized protein (TIGR00251 family)